MSEKIDVSIAFYGKPHQTIVTIQTLLRYSNRHIDKIYLTNERSQPHGDYSGIYKVTDYFRGKPDIRLEIFRPRYFIAVGVNEYDRAKRDTAYRQSIMFQYPLETTDKKYLCVIHNDMFFYGDIIGEMLKRYQTGAANLAGIGSIGQCWSCPAGPDWGNVCNSEKYREYVPTQEEALQLAAAHNTPRQALQIAVIRNGRVHPLPECRLNEYCAMIAVDIYRRETIPAGTIGCYGGSWKGVDLGTVWSHDMYRKGYVFQNILLEDYVKHAAFDHSGSGTESYSRSTTYWASEARAKAYIEKEWGELHFSWLGRLQAFRARLVRILFKGAGYVYRRLRGGN